jgi:hypothetical protein
VVASGSPDAHVRRILYNQRVSWWRSGASRREYLVDSVPERVHADDPVSSVVTRVAVAKVLGRLTAKQRTVIVLRFFEDLPEAEIATILGCSIGTVRGIRSRPGCVAPSRTGVILEGSDACSAIACLAAGAITFRLNNPTACGQVDLESVV